MLNVNQTVRSCQEILVVLVPIGNISKDKFNKYASYVRQQSVVELREHANYFERNRFPSRNWDKDRVHFNFESYEFVQKSDWDELHAHKKIYGVIGLVDCGAEGSLESAYRTFSDSVKPYVEWADAPTTLSGIATAAAAKEKSGRRASVSSRDKAVSQSSRLCFAFEPRPEQIDVAHEEFKVIPNQDDEHINFYVKHLLLIDLVAPMLEKLGLAYESLPDIIEKVGNNPQLNQTPLDSDFAEDNKTTSTTSSKKKKKKQARLRKQQADCALLAGSPIDSLTLYTIAIEQSKLYSDWEWVAAALEGWVAATLLILNGPESPELQKEISDKLTEALGFYKLKKSEPLEVEICLKFARYLMVKDRKLEALDLLSSAYALSSMMSVQEKIRLASAMALIFKSAGMNRKFSFFMREVACLCANIMPFSKSHQLLLGLAEFYQLDPDLDVDVGAIRSPAASPDSSLSASQGHGARPQYIYSRRSAIVAQGTRWTRLRSSLLAALIRLSQQNGDATQTIKHLVYMLKDVVPEETAQAKLFGNEVKGSDSAWVDYLKDAANLLPPVSTAADLQQLSAGLGICGAFSAVVDETIQMRVSRHIVDPLFLYRPKRFTKAGKEVDKEVPVAYTWAGHTAHFNLLLQNPLVATLEVSSITLEVQPVLVKVQDRDKFELVTECDMELVSVSQPSVHVDLKPKQVVQLRIPYPVADLTNAPAATSTQLFVLLVPRRLRYRVLNCEFSECLVSIDSGSPLTALIPKSLRYLQFVPSLGVSQIGGNLRNVHTETAGTSQLLGARLVANGFDPTSSTTSSTIGSPPSFDNMLSTVVPHGSAIAGVANTYNTPTVETQLFFGEKWQTVLELHNRDTTLPIDEILLEVSENGHNLLPMGEGAQFSSSTIKESIADIITILNTALPLAPASSLYLPIRLEAVHSVHNLGLTFYYRNSRCQPSMYKMSRWFFSGRATSGLRITDASNLVTHDRLIEQLSSEVRQPSDLTTEGETKVKLITLDVQNTSDMCFDLVRMKPGTLPKLSGPPISCEKCEKTMVELTGLLGSYHLCSGFPDCVSIVKREAPNLPSCAKCAGATFVHTSSHGSYLTCSKCSSKRTISSIADTEGVKLATIFKQSTARQVIGVQSALLETIAQEVDSRVRVLVKQAKPKQPIDVPNVTTGLHAQAADAMINLHWTTPAGRSGAVILDETQVPRESLAKLVTQLNINVSLRIISAEDSSAPTVQVGRVVLLEAVVSAGARSSLELASSQLKFSVISTNVDSNTPSATWIGKQCALLRSHPEHGSCFPVPTALCFHIPGTFSIRAVCENMTTGTVHNSASVRLKIVN